jgi:cytidine deaminase
MSERFDLIVYTPSDEEIKKERGWIYKQIEEIGEESLKNLAKSAAKVRPYAYQPYSNYSVGASVLTPGGEIYSSCNAETVTYTETDHAERSAITKAISEGAKEKYGRVFIKAVAVSHTGESGPCGGCRQRILEHSDNCLILDVDEDGEIVKITSANILLPYAFTPASLGIK